MRYISAYEYVVGKAKMTMIFAVYLQSSCFPISGRNMLSISAVHSLSDVVPPCRTPLLMLVLLLSLCRWTVIELLV